MQNKRWRQSWLFIAVSHRHEHKHELPANGNADKAFIAGIVLNFAFVLVEAAVGVINHSMSLLTDAGHNLSDVSSLFISLFAFRLAKKKSTEEFTYGYKKTTILAALINAVILLIALGAIGYESVLRLIHPSEVKGDQIAWVAGVGILINGVSAYLFFKDRKKDLNVKGAYLHLLADALVSLGVVIAGLVIHYTEWFWLDPVVGLIIMIVILISTWSLLKGSFKMSIDAVPDGVDLSAIKNSATKIYGVKEIHHVHIWSISTTENALTAHIVPGEHLTTEERKQMVKQLKEEFLRHNIHHCTIELDR